MADIAMTAALAKALGGGGEVDPAVIEGAVNDWLDDHPEATTTVQDGSITKAKLDSDLQGTVDDVGKLNSAVDENLFSDTPTALPHSKNNYKVTDSGFYATDVGYYVSIIPVTPGWNLKIEATYMFQFQNTNTVPYSGDSTRVGDTYGAGVYHLTVPQGASYLAVSVPKTNDNSHAYFETKRVAETENRLLNDEDIFLLLEKEKDNIREINLNASFFQQGYSSRRTTLKVFNPTTSKGWLFGTPTAELYDNLDIGKSTIYLEAGDKIITNIDAIYNNARLRLPNTAFSNNGYYGVILSSFTNNNDTDNATIYYGRESFDGKWRVLEIGVTGYYELSYRNDVSYTNKAYIWHQHNPLINQNDIIADVTNGLSFYDGYVQYNSSTGWSDQTTQDIGSAGRYQYKTVLLSNLSDYAGKSVLISGLSSHSTEPPTANEAGYPSVIYYSDGEPSTYRMARFRYVFDKDYAAFPIISGYDMRIQFTSRACLPFVRVWIVDNDTLFKNNLANPVFYGKKILGFGDSYIAGQGVTMTWHQILAERNVCDYVKKGYGGAGLCFGANGSLLSHISDLDEDADIYFLTFGRNDSSTNIKIGTDEDEISDDPADWTSEYLINTATFKGAMNYLFNYIETLHPNAQIVCVTPWGFENNAGVTSGLICLDYIEAMKRIGEKWSVYCFNAAQDCGIHVRSEAFRTAYFLASNDQSHLNYNGHTLMYKRAIKLLTNQMYDE